eukprot:CAMPEP_0183381572 /NCGR_PEP_ID=MMETSP0164_2-20130417/126508_1 /TAXON_ID=221442 /ORGANISM="Coccolithus pelagicus ssp braarudi, Strain PLY182g" /LENGTH=117 /DNA_ID=CAMNT_0025559183 /DNA_START=293 /DNA_END=646 /DNA_ORIENTATION=+
MPRARNVFRACATSQGIVSATSWITAFTLALLKRPPLKFACDARKVNIHGLVFAERRAERRDEGVGAVAEQDWASSSLARTAIVGVVPNESWLERRGVALGAGVLGFDEFSLTSAAR